MVLWISSDRDNQRIFFGLKCSSPGFLFSLGGGGGGGVGNLASIFLDGLI